MADAIVAAVKTMDPTLAILAISGTQLENPDFAMLANAYGGHGIRVETDAEVQSVAVVIDRSFDDDF